MNLLIYGKKEESDVLMQMIRTQTNLAFRNIVDFQTEDYDTLLEYLRTVEYDMVIVLTDCAAGKYQYNPSSSCEDSALSFSA